MNEYIKEEINKHPLKSFAKSWFDYYISYLTCLFLKGENFDNLEVAQFAHGNSRAQQKSAI